ncbi:MAG: sugar ABC transporter substrate-binding protein [Chloroflexi bacterium]|nr:MAG: sugar ABC transporter substrate-binding protein [Chloroflexota bacterium]
MKLFFFPSWMSRSAARFSIVIFALVLMAPLAACGGGSSSTTGGTSSGPVTLTYWAWISSLPEQVALFNKTHPNIHVNLVNVGSSQVEYDKLFTAIKAANEPDLAEVEFQALPTFETTGGLLDLAPYGAASVKDQFVPYTWSQVLLGNSILAIPQDTGPMGLWYRQDIFQKYNIPVPTTWAQFADDAAKLHAANPNYYLTDFPPKGGAWFTGLQWQAGGRPFNINGQSWKVSINNPQAQQVASYWQDLIDKKLVKTEPDFTNGWYHDLQTGALSTWVGAAWGNGVLEQNAPQTSGKWRVAPLPQWQASQSVSSNWGGSSTAVFKSSKHPKEATEFAEWISNNEQSAEIEFKGGAYPCLLSALSSSTMNSPQPFFGNQVINTVFKQSASQVDTSFHWGPTMNQVFTDMSDNFANAINGKGTLTDALNATQQSTVTFMKKQGFNVTT